MKKSTSLKLVASRGAVQFGTKATTLERLQGKLRTAKVLPTFHFSVAEWEEDEAAVLQRIQSLPWADQELVVRSSARAEDSHTSSLAGHFDSVLAVRGLSAITTSIRQVIRSFGVRANRLNDRVLLQPCLKNVALSGVAFSVDPNTTSGYTVINYDDKSGSTQTVTEGSTNDLHTYYYFPNQKVLPPAPLNQVVDLVAELEFLFDYPTIDLEFAIDRSGQLYLFQCRPLTNVPYEAGINEEVRRALVAIEKKVRVLGKPHPYLYGEKTVFGVMPDWNPAEIIGIRPRPLALSLYKELVTDAIWAYQRDNYGYRNLRSFPLLISLAGLPYVDVRVSFNSFVPQDITPDLGQRLVDHYIAQLIDSPTKHDKVEFAILHTCYTLDIDQRMKQLSTAGFSSKDCQELKESLRKLTNRIIHGEQGLWKRDIEKIRQLESRLAEIKNSPLDKVAKIYWLLEDCKRYGTLPFAGLARAGFIAVQMLQSLRTVGVLSDGDYHAFMLSLETVSTRMKSDFASLSKDDFLQKYGHLRPGTYDILSARYDEEPDKYFNWKRRSPEPAIPSAPATATTGGVFSLSLPQLKGIEKLLHEHHLEHDVITFFEFIKAAIEGREFAKFVFTRSLSDALSYFKELCAENSISVEDAAYADVRCIHQLYSSSQPAGDLLRHSIADGQLNYEITRRIHLPPLLVTEQDIWSFEIPTNEPNYITQKSLQGAVCPVTEAPAAFNGCILMIPSADPGYDWIFSHGIAGLITMYGGANSHMAIRAGELGIPAVIGAGEKLFSQWATASELLIDCMNRQVRVLR